MHKSPGIDFRFRHHEPRRGFRVNDKIYSFIIVVFRYCQSVSIINNALCDNWNIYHVCCFFSTVADFPKSSFCRFLLSSLLPFQLNILLVLHISSEEEATFLCACGEVLCVDCRKNAENFHPRSTSSDFFCWLVGMISSVLRHPPAPHTDISMNFVYFLCYLSFTFLY